MKAEKEYYFAYGSNLSQDRMRSRVPGAKAYAVGFVKGWKVVERLYADIEEDADGVAWGVVYELDEAGLLKLDRFEGFPFTYAGRYLSVKTKRGIVRAFAYMMTDAARAFRDGVPYPEDYRKICSRGADAFGIPNAFKKGQEVA